MPIKEEWKKLLKRRLFFFNFALAVWDVDWFILNLTAAHDIKIKKLVFSDGLDMDEHVRKLDEQGNFKREIGG